jgi:hypothetical protein
MIVGPSATANKQNYDANVAQNAGQIFGGNPQVSIV